MPLPGPTRITSDVAPGSAFAHWGSESIGSGRGFGGVPENVTAPTIVPGPSAVSVAAGAAAGGGCPAGAGDGSDPPHATAATIATATHATGRFFTLNVSRFTS